MLTNKRIGLVYTGGRFFGEREDIILPRKLYHRFSVLIGGRALGGEIGIIGGALTRRAAFESVGGLDPALVSYEDLDLVIRICLKGWKVKPVFELLYFPRKHGAELAHRHPEYDTLGDKYLRSVLDRKFWYLPLYRRLFFVYRVLFEKLFFMIQMPKAYLNAFSKKYRLTNRAKLYPWHNPTNQRNGAVLARLITTEIYDLLAARVAREPFLIKYHQEELARLEADFLNLTTEDSSRRVYNE
jgi:GT2 family glycosyltransferase